ncbi:MAG TPA: phospholipid carrier-dependent glycosyltransferase [Anaerolineales bacterium]|nr:phospholipid carrier-dependent glycosyltransferase [Anaerolineales bacterium]
MKQIRDFLSSRSWIIPLLLGLAFVALTARGIDWGIRGGWNPDEIIQKVIKALHGEYLFDEDDFTYPSLPKYAMFAVGRVVLGLGYGDPEVTWWARLISAALGAGIVALTYVLARRIGLSNVFASLAALFVFTSSLLAQNAHFAHNDIYITFFTLLAVWASLRYAQTAQRGWFYLACFTVGLAASSKYNGISLLLLPLVLFFLVGDIRKSKHEWLRVVETLGLGLVLTFLGYAAGTPKALTWMTFYFKRMVPDFLAHAAYGYQPDSVRGLIGQWGTLTSALGVPFAILGALAFGYAVVEAGRQIKDETASAAAPKLVIPMAILAIDLPIMLSYNYQARFFLPMVPLLAVLAAQLAQTVFHWLEKRARPAGSWAFTLAVAGLLIFSFLRVIGVMLLFENDARIAAGEFIAQLPDGRSLEHTFYPPYMNQTAFARQHNYPLYFIKYPGETVPTGGRLQYNQGEAGLDERGTDYFVVDSFTFNRFKDPFVCEAIPIECEFFTNLLDGNTNYVLIGEFHYRLPPWIPPISGSFLNPDILIFERAT